jgi:hypothetical protein
MTKPLALVAAALVVLAAALPATASAATETATSGPVTATFTYDHNASEGTYSSLHLTIRRLDATVLDQAVASPDCGDGCWPGSGASDRKSVTVRDLDKDGEPEVILDLFTGGAHCCVVTQVFRYVASGPSPGYAKVEHNFADPSYRLTDIERDGVPEFKSNDARFAYAVSSYAGSSMPIQIWRFRGGKFVDVTRSYKSLIRADSKRNWRTYRKYIRNTAPNNDPGLGGLIAWAGDEYLLGHGSRVQRELKAALRRGWLNGGFTRGAGTVRAINRFLKSAGYMR